MCKTIKRCFFKKLTYEKILSAHFRASKCKSNKREVLRFNIDLETNIINIINSLKNNSYRLGKYYEFNVYEPKLRVIKALPYKDRIVQQWYVEEFIKPYVLPRFIYDSYACIDGKGTHLAIKNLQKYMRLMKRKYGNYYVVKCDIQKFFYTIDKDILYGLMKNYITDKNVLNLTKVFIYDNDSKVGIPIGNYTSQFYANIYLNVLDKFIKEELKIKYYVRYMDDFIFLADTKERAKKLFKIISSFVFEKLNLKLNYKSKYYPSKMGVDFCGYIIFETHILLRKRSKKKIKKNICKWNKLYLSDKLDNDSMILSWNSWVGHAMHSCSFNLRKKMYDSVLNNICFRKW